MVKDKSYAPRTPIVFVVSDDEQTYTLQTFRRKYAPEKTISQLRNTYLNLDRPPVVSIEDMLSISLHGKKSEIFIKVGKKKRLMSLKEIGMYCNKKNGIVRTGQFYYARWIAGGSKTEIENLKLFLMSPDQYKYMRQAKHNEHRNIPDMAHIPAGDLVHLTSKKRDSNLANIPKSSSFEQSMFPHAGKNGFNSSGKIDSFCGYDSAGHSVYSGAR